MSTCVPALHLTVDGQPVAVPPGLTLAQLLRHLGVPAEAVATALNGQFVARERRATITLAAGDRVTLVQAITGG